jgi:hypothetical protein
VLDGRTGQQRQPLSGEGHRVGSACWHDGHGSAAGNSSGVGTTAPHGCERKRAGCKTDGWTDVLGGRNRTVHFGERSGARHTGSESGPSGTPAGSLLSRELTSLVGWRRGPQGPRVRRRRRGKVESSDWAGKRWQDGNNPRPCIRRARGSRRTAVTGRSALRSRLEGHREEVGSSGQAAERGSRGNGKTNPQSVSG